MQIDSEDFIKWCEEEKLKSEARMRSFLRSDGIAKPGKAGAVMGAGDYIRGYEHTIENVERYIKSLENHDVGNKTEL